MLTFRDTDKKFEMQGNLLKMITNKNYNVDFAKILVKKIMFDLAKEEFLDENIYKKSIRDRILIQLLKSGAITASISKIRNKVFIMQSQ